VRVFALSAEDRRAFVKLSGPGSWLPACLVPAQGRPGARHHGAAHVL